MRREEAIELMTNVIISMNKERGALEQIPAETLGQMLQEMVPELTRVNGLLFDALYDAGVINLHA
tara:strand:+ start:6574 stop:6768 length:195 start_codon:yes stop_codon:yes gene_type:complete